MSRLYAEEGYALSFAIIPQQTVRDGVVRLKVIEGRIDQVDVHLRGSGGVAGKRRIEAAIREYFRELANGHPVRSADLERVALRVDDLAGYQPRLTVKPSRSVEGAADLMVELDFQPVGAGLSIDNRLRFEFGREAVTADAAIRSLVVVGDELQMLGRMICPPLSGPETMIVWTTKGTTNAEQEAQAGRDYRQAA